ncbi:MAG: AI-2E family transporter [Cyanobacteria bacterium]|jgi:predicted PurR-regulated permease PerM|nr:AI-2E family transporter [Cyanobacteria bacterium GSL.Bin21]
MNTITPWYNRLTTAIPRWLVVLLIFPLIILDGWLLLLFIDYFNQLISSFVAASLLAFLLNYPVQALEKLKMRRVYSVLLVFFVAIIISGLVALLSIPFLIEQFETLRDRVPSWAESAEAQLQQLAMLVKIDLSAWSEEIEATLREQLQSVLMELPNVALGTISNFFQVFFILVLTVFLAIFYQGFLHSTIETWFPEQGSSVLRSLRRNFNSYVVNQFTLATSITLTLIPAFWLLNVPFYLLFAIGIGVIGLIPFGAVLSIFVVSFILSLKSIWLGLKVLTVALILDQLIENTITPRLLGTLTGLNPIVILFSLMVGARVAGYLGILTAVPIAATLKSTLRLLSQKHNLPPAMSGTNKDTALSGTNPP